MKWINAEQQVTVTIYDEEHEEYLDRTMSVEEMLDTYTNEGCPTIYSNPEQTRWISIEERLPEENLPVLVTVKQQDRLPRWVKEQTYSYVTDIDVYDDGDFDTRKNKVVAWMPLPTPYEPQESEDKE